MKGRRSARKCTPFLNTSIPCKTALGLSWNTACARARCAVFSPAVIRRCACFSPDRTGSRSLDIAAKYGTTVAKLAADNGIKNPNLIHVGQVITINK